MNAPVTEIGGQELGPRVREAWLIRYGMWVMLAVMAALFGAAALTPYGGGVTTAPVQFAPADALAAPAAGRVHLLVREGDLVQEHQPIAAVNGGDAGVRTAVVMIPANEAAKIHPGHPATLLLGDDRRMAATVVAVRAAQNDRVPLVVRLDAQTPALLRGTLSISIPPTPLIKRLLRSSIPQ